MVPFDGVIFEMVPIDMLRDIRRIEPVDIRVWGFLLHDARFRGHCELTDAELAGMCGVSQQTIRRSLLRLTRAGWIDRVGGRCRRVLLNARGEEAFTPRLKIRSKA
jgi:predicted transcriptional regulator of viral defense system